ncbi:hypothetical protein EEB14_08470 [Rhodococcus sp. WS4]|nr:hypothetical protein EEB14_08470 [Rhodococcus sp. WS4]
MISRTKWAAIVLIVGGGPALVLCVLNGFVPGLDDVRDPLGRPSTLSQELIVSASQLDELTSEIVPKHSQFSEDIQVLIPLADDLEDLTNRSAEMSGQTVSVNASTQNVTTIVAPLPDLVVKITGRAEQTGSTVANLATAVGSVTTQLETINQNLTAVQGTLGELGPRGSAIAASLANIEQEARHVQAFGPLLAVIGPPVNSLNLPPLGLTTPAPTS